MSYNPLNFEPDELINVAIMSQTPVLIVEGVDDVPLYERITLSLQKDYDIYASENLLNLTCRESGCRGVIKALEKIEEIDFKDYEKYIVGIIDRDVSTYLNIQYNLKGLFISKNYSIESDFINKEMILYLLETLTNATQKLIEEPLIDKIFKELIDKLIHCLYYVSLESLKNACNSDYVGEYTYEQAIEHIMNTDLSNFFSNKKEELDLFAKEKNISKNFANLLLISKGKWIINQFIFLLKNEFSELPRLCQNGEIKKCQFCIIGNEKKCLYKLVLNYNNGSVRNLMFRNLNHSGIDYIKTKLLTLE